MTRFCILQAADCLTTLAFLALGADEGNPLARGAMALAGVWGLLLFKLLAIGIGVACWRSGRLRAVRMVNSVFTVVVGWNVVVIGLKVAGI